MPDTLVVCTPKTMVDAATCLKEYLFNNDQYFMKSKNCNVFFNMTTLANNIKAENTT